jgi:hypothetical protein
MHNAPFLDRDGATIILALLAARKHTEAGVIAQRYLSLPFVGPGRQEDAPMVLDTPQAIERFALVQQLLPHAFAPGATAGSTLCVVLSDMKTADTAGYRLDRLIITEPPHEAVTFMVEPFGKWPPFPLSFAQRSGVAERLDPLPRVTRTASIPGTVLIEVAPFVVSTIIRNRKGKRREAGNKTSAD